MQHIKHEVLTTLFTKIQVFWNVMLCQSPSRHGVMSQDLNLQVHNKNKSNSYSYVMKSSNKKTGKICQVISHKPQILSTPQNGVLLKAQSLIQSHVNPFHTLITSFLKISLILFPIYTSRSLSTLQISWLKFFFKFLISQMRAKCPAPQPPLLSW